MKIGYLADHQEFIGQLAALFKSEWGARYPERTLEDWKKQIYPNKDELPCTIVGFKETELGKRLIVSASLRKGGMDTHPELETWLSYVFTNPEFRGMGYATTIVSEAIRIAQEKGVSSLHLFTRTNGNIYRRLGWHDIERTNYKGGPVIVMSRTLESK